MNLFRQSSRRTTGTAVVLRPVLPRAVSGWLARTAIAVLLAASASWPVQAQTTVQNTATVAPPAGTTNRGVACAAAGGSFTQGDGVCSASVVIPVNAGAPELELEKSAPATAPRGTVFDYTITLHNRGTAATTAEAVVTDTVPEGLTITTPVTGCSVAGQTVTCAVAQGLAAGDSAVFTLSVTATAQAGARVENRARVTGGGDPACTAAAPCDSPTVTTLLLAVEATDDDAGNTPKTTPVTTSVLDNDSAVNGTLDPGSVTVTVPSAHGTTQVDATTGRITFTPATGFSGTTTYTYEVCLAAPHGAVCDTAVVTVTVDPMPALELEKTVSSTGPYGLGDTITYAFELKNSGDVALSGVTVLDALAGLSPVTCPSTTLAAGAAMTC
ncbi:DUF7507 domain-containing protein, partial [Stenotrophomonas mori]